MQHLTVEAVHIDLADQNIIRDVTFHLNEGELGSLLGPSGCGKTSLLRALAGLQKPSNGRIFLRDTLISSSTSVLPPEQRRMGMVFQDLALFPHLTVSGNVGFGIRHLSERQQSARVGELLELVSLQKHAHKYPHELSGGQQQRVALIRAMASRPAVLLLDEPFSGQDIERREQLAKDVASILRQDGITALLVTHDQYEAFAFSDVIGVMNEGHLLQWDRGFNLYHKPADRFVADFIGQGVFLSGKVIDHNKLQTELGIVNGEMVSEFPPGTDVDFLVRPDDILHDDLSEKKAVVEQRSF